MIINKLNILNVKKHIGDVRKNVLTTTRAGLAINPLSSYNPVSVTSIANNTVVSQDEYTFVGGDTQSFSYDFGTKVAGSVTQCPLKIYSQDVDLANLPNPTTGWTEETSQSKIDRLKAQNNVPFSGSVNQTDYTYTYNSVTYDDNTVQVIDDFVGKVSGSITENPHIGKYSNGQTSLLAPSSFTSEFTGTTSYDKVATLNGICGTLSVTANGCISQQLFSINLIRIIEDKFGEIPATDKVQWLKNNLKVVAFKWYGFGSCPSGNKACLSYYYNGIWQAPQIHTNSTVTNRTIYYSIPNDFTGSIQSDGFIHYIAYTDASDGATASTICTDYVSVEVTLKCPNNYGTNNPMTSNYANKVVGSTVENPNIFKHNNNQSNSTLLSPSSFTSELQSVSYVQALGDSSVPINATTNNSIPQMLFSFDLIQIVERKLGYSIPASDKVAWLKANVNRLDFKWYGYGSCPSGNKAKIAWYSSSWLTNSSVGSDLNTSSSPTLLSSYYLQYNASPSVFIQSDGFTHFLAYTDASNGTTASTIYTDYVELVVTLKSNRLLTPTNTRRDGTKGEVLVVNEQDFSVSKLYDGSALGGYAITTNKAKAYLVEIDLTAVCNGLYGGSNASMKSGVKGIQLTMWAKGTGSNNGLLASGVQGRIYDINNTWEPSNAYNSGNTNNTTSNITQTTGIINTNVDSAYRVQSTNKIYILVHSTYASDGTIPSTLDLDFLSVRVDFTRVADTSSGTYVTLPPYWALLIKGFSPNWDSTVSSSVRYFLSHLMTDACTSHFVVDYTTNKFRFRRIVNGVTKDLLQTTTPTFSKNQIFNILAEVTPTGAKLRVLKNNGTIEHNTSTEVMNATGSHKFKPLINTYDYYGSNQADAFFESLTLFRKNFTDTEAENLLRGNNPIFSNKELFDINQVSLHANATRSNGVITHVVTAPFQYSSIYVPVLPNNTYEISCSFADSGKQYLSYIGYNNNVVVTGESSINGCGKPLTNTFTTGSTTNRIRIMLYCITTGTYTFSNISLKLKM